MAPDRITGEDGVWVPRSVTMKDLRDETSTTLVVGEIALHQQIPRRTSPQARLEKGH